MKLKSYNDYPLSNAGLLLWQISTKLMARMPSLLEVNDLNMDVCTSGLMERPNIKEIALMSLVSP